MKEIRISVVNEDRIALERCRAEGACANLADDGRDYSRTVIDKPWGFEYQCWATKDGSCWTLHLNPGGETSMHCHPNKDTLLIVAAGQVEFETLTKKMTLREGAMVRIERGAFHRSASTLGAVLIELESSPNRRDLVRALDKYGREGKGY